MTSQVTYNGDLRTTAVHIQSGSAIESDAPVDNKGKGERFSPTDMVATALASCMLTTIGIAANTHNFSIVGAVCDVEKIMYPDPRRIGEIRIAFHFPKGMAYSVKEKTIIERSALTCPVHISLHPDLKKTVTFNFPNE